MKCPALSETQDEHCDKCCRMMTKPATPRGVAREVRHGNQNSSRGTESPASDLARLSADGQGTHGRINDLMRRVALGVHVFTTAWTTWPRTEPGVAAVHPRIDDVASPLTQRIADTTTTLTQRVDDQVHHTDRSVDAVNERVDRLMRRMETGFGQIRSFRRGLLTDIALLPLRVFVNSKPKRRTSRPFVSA